MVTVLLGVRTLTTRLNLWAVLCQSPFPFVLATSHSKSGIGGGGESS
jgi:hypothetical protein